MEFCHLHAHTTYSFLDGYGTARQVADRVSDLGHTACAITDHGNLFAHVPVAKEFKKRDLKFIPGCEFYICRNVEEQAQEDQDLGVKSYSHVTVLAATQKGYENLLTLSRLSYEHAYYKPRIDWRLLARHQEGLVVLSGCPMGFPTRILQTQGVAACYQWFECRCREIERFYVEIDPSPGWDVSEDSTRKLVGIAGSLGLPLVLTADAHFPRPEDFDAQDTLCAASMGRRRDDPQRAIKLDPSYYYCTGAELMARAIRCAPEIPPSVWELALKNTATIANNTDVALPRAGKLLYPGVGPGQTAATELARLIRDGLLFRFQQGKIPPDQFDTYVARAHREWLVLGRKGFHDYMLVIIDVIRAMKKRGALVVTRGSAGGCLTLWLTGASITDPIRHELSFERFYDDSRSDPPDVDMDFEKGRREEAIAYMREKYGYDKTAQIAALSQLKTKSAVHDVATAYGIPREHYAPLVNAVSSQDDDADRQLHEIADLRALAVLKKYPCFAAMVPRLIGQYRQPSIHAAGLLVSDTPLDKAVGLICKLDTAQTVAAVDKRGAAELGFLKMDLLSVNALDVIAAAVRRLGHPMEWLEDLPLDDPAALDIARRGMLAGIFQLDGASAARTLREIGVETFADLAAASALCRPGPADWVPTYSRHRRDPLAFDAHLARLHPAAAEVVRGTLGILIYQEQVMRLAHEVAGLSMPEVQKLRKGVSDKLGTQPDKEKADAWLSEWSAKFITGAIQHGMQPQEAAEWWKAIQTHGGYSFNQSHCVTYAFPGYWMCYLKAHHPGAFYEAYLSLEEDPITLKRLIREFTAAGGTVELLSPGTSRTRFSSAQPGTLTGGFVNLRGIGPKTAQKLQEKVPFGNWDELLAALPKATRRSLVKTGAPEGEWDDVQELVALAPWFPVPKLGAFEAAFRDRYGLPKIISLPLGRKADGDVSLCGYVTATAFTKEKVIFMLEDETAGAVVRLPNRLVTRQGGEFRSLKVGDFIVARGWWAGDALYIKTKVVVRAAAAVKGE